MINKQLISAHLPFLSTKDTIEKAIALMQDFHITQLPVVENEKYLGLISEEELMDSENELNTLGNTFTNLYKPAVLANMHIYDAVKIMAENSLQLLPVVDEKENFIGSIYIDTIFKILADGLQCKENGGIIALEATQHNFSISQISRIFESENVQILSILIHTIPENNNLKITIKTNKQELMAVVATLERFGFIVTEDYSLSTESNDLKDNYHSLINYLKI